MADQATMTGNGPATARAGIAGGGGPGRSPARGGNGAGPIAVVSNLSEFGEDLLNLAELQARLAATELKENIEATKYGAVALLVGSMLALGTLPVLLTGIAELLVSELGMKQGVALLTVAVVALAIAGACVAIALVLLRKVPGFPVTKEELTRNLSWIRAVLLHNIRSTRQR